MVSATGQKSNNTKLKQEHCNCSEWSACFHQALCH